MRPKILRNFWMLKNANALRTNYFQQFLREIIFEKFACEFLARLSLGGFVEFRRVPNKTNIDHLAFTCFSYKDIFRVNLLDRSIDTVGD